MANQIEIKRFKEGGLCEIYQDMEMKFAFVSDAKDGYRQCHPLVMCRDFLQDGLRAFITKSNSQIYGFRYKYGDNPPLDLKKTRLLVKKADKHADHVTSVTDDEFKTQMGRAKRLLVHYEKKARWPETTVLKVKGDTALRVFQSSANWMKAPHLISLYTLLIRLGSYPAAYKGVKKEETLQEKFVELIEDQKDKGRNKRMPLDVSYLKKTHKHFPAIMARCDEIVDAKIEKNYPPVGIHSLHDHSGIVSLCDGSHCDKELYGRFKKIISAKK